MSPTLHGATVLHGQSTLRDDEAKPPAPSAPTLFNGSAAASLLDLPTEIKEHIVNFVPLHDASTLCRLSRVSKEWAVLLESHTQAARLYNGIVDCLKTLPEDLFDEQKFAGLLKQAGVPPLSERKIRVLALAWAGTKYLPSTDFRAEMREYILKAIGCDPGARPIERGKESTKQPWLSPERKADALARLANGLIPWRLSSQSIDNMRQETSTAFSRIREEIDLLPKELQAMAYTPLIAIIPYLPEGEKSSAYYAARDKIASFSAQHRVAAYSVLRRQIPWLAEIDQRKEFSFIKGEIQGERNRLAERDQEAMLIEDVELAGKYKLEDTSDTFAYVLEEVRHLPEKFRSSVLAAVMSMVQNGQSLKEGEMEGKACIVLDENRRLPKAMQAAVLNVCAESLSLYPDEAITRIMPIIIQDSEGLANDSQADILIKLTAVLHRVDNDHFTAQFGGIQECAAELPVEQQANIYSSAAEHIRGFPEGPMSDVICAICHGIAHEGALSEPALYAALGHVRAVIWKLNDTNASRHKINSAIDAFEKAVNLLSPEGECARIREEMQDLVDRLRRENDRLPSQCTLT